MWPDAISHVLVNIYWAISVVIETEVGACGIDWVSKVAGPCGNRLCRLK